MRKKDFIRTNKTTSLQSEIADIVEKAGIEPKESYLKKPWALTAYLYNDKYVILFYNKCYHVTDGYVSQSSKHIEDAEDFIFEIAQREENESIS
jgi:hypothetical protein